MKVLHEHKQMQLWEPQEGGQTSLWPVCPRWFSKEAEEGVA